MPLATLARVIARSALAVMAVFIAVTAAAPAAVIATYPRTPIITGPVAGGIRSGLMWGATPDYILAPVHYIEQEYFVQGTASNLGRSWGVGLLFNPNPPLAPVTSAPYKINLVVHRPADPAKFNGVVVVEWDNVTTQGNVYGVWASSNQFLMRHGYVVVDVSAQKAGVDGGTPLSLKLWDLVRYGSLEHPGDQYAFDIYAQVAWALRHPRAGAPNPLGRPHPKALLATGGSQSCLALVPFVNVVEKQYPLFDGVAPYRCNPARYGPNVVKTLFFNSEDESSLPGTLISPPGVPGGRLFGYWEAAGDSHADWDLMYWIVTSFARDELSIGGTPSPVPSYDPSLAYQYGQEGLFSVAPCPANYYPGRYVYDNAIYQLSRWALGGPAPARAPRFDLKNGFLVKDRYGNTIGGLRSPVVDVPVATYVADKCALVGATVPLLPTVLKQLYPTHAAYVQKMQAATTADVDKGWLLPEDGCQLMQMAIDSTISGSDRVNPIIPECQLPIRNPWNTTTHRRGKHSKHRHHRHPRK